MAQTDETVPSRAHQPRLSLDQRLERYEPPIDGPIDGPIERMNWKPLEAEQLEEQ
jgi:hypothetical protein